MTIRRVSARGAPGRQEGVVLFVAIIVLIVMSLAGLALLRQMGAGTSIAGNVAFKENATSVADRGVEVARKFIVDNPNALATTNAAVGYYSNWTTNVDPVTFVDWEDTSKVKLLAVGDDDSATGHETRYVIHRLCEQAGVPANAAGQYCSDGAGKVVGTSMGSAGYGSTNFSPLPTPFYRVTARVKGPRNTFSYVQVVMN